MSYDINLARNWPRITRYYYDVLYGDDQVQDRSIWEWLEEDFGAHRVYTPRKDGIGVVATALRFSTTSDMTAFTLKFGNLLRL